MKLGERGILRTMGVPSKSGLPVGAGVGAPLAQKEIPLTVGESLRFRRDKVADDKSKWLKSNRGAFWLNTTRQNELRMQIMCRPVL